MPDSTTEELLDLTRRLLDSIMSGDWQTYAELCDETLTAFEPESAGQLVHGLAFHKYFFDLGVGTTPRAATICSPHVRVMGDSAVVSYGRLNQSLSADGRPVTSSVYETRVWQKMAGRWKHVHFHRSRVQ
jgi:calcium/calmodulin-dependent protein kinase (CaM kinase) II